MNANTTFTVARLIEKLREFPPDLPVITSGYEGDYENIVLPKQIQVKYIPDEAWYNGQFHQSGETGEDVFEAVVIAREERTY